MSGSDNHEKKAEVSDEAYLYALDLLRRELGAISLVSKYYQAFADLVDGQEGANEMNIQRLRFEEGSAIQINLLESLRNRIQEDRKQ